MITKEELGKRIRRVRKERGLTLKQLEVTSGFSATHISEIERGKTSPTIGALIHIARALGKEASFFLEEEQLSEVAVVRREERPPLPVDEARVKGEYLTPGIPGGRLNAYMIHLEPNHRGEVIYSPHDGEEALYVLAGSLRYRVGDQVFQLHAGDTIHYPCVHPHGFETVGEEGARVLFTSTKRLRKNRSSSGATARLL